MALASPGPGAYGASESYGSARGSARFRGVYISRADKGSLRVRDGTLQRCGIRFLRPELRSAPVLPALCSAELHVGLGPWGLTANRRFGARVKAGVRGSGLEGTRQALQLSCLV